MTPKQLFLTKEPLVKQMHDIVMTSAFLEGSHAALAEFALKLEADASMAGAAYYQLMGARDFLNTLRTIADIPKPPESKRTSGNLQTNI